jgi:hypothetical protein
LNSYKFWANLLVAYVASEFFMVAVSVRFKNLPNLEVLRINLELIAKHLEGMIRIAGIGNFQSSQRQNGRVKTFQQYGTNETHRSEISR